MAHRSEPPVPNTRKLLVYGAIGVPLGLAAVYLTFFLALLTPFFQRHFIFLHSVRYPFSPDFANPARYGVAPFKARNVILTSTDEHREVGNVKRPGQIGAWHILPETFYQSQLRSHHQRHGAAEGKNGISDPMSDDVYATALRELPTIIYLHGNAMSRAAPFRVSTYSALTSRIEANVIAIDYRGFGDSAGTPSEAGLVHDAYTAYRWVLSHRDGNTDDPQPSVTVFGQSLGTGIAALLALQIQKTVETVPLLDNIVLMAPYASLRLLVSDYRIGGVLPVLAPLKAIPFHDYLLTKFMKTHLNTLDTLPQLLFPLPASSQRVRKKTNIVLLHAEDDDVIPVRHSHLLFEAVLKQSSSSASVQERSIQGFADVRRFNAHPTDRPDTGTVVTFIRTKYGGHNQLSEGALDLVRFACGLPSAFVKI